MNCDESWKNRAPCRGIVASRGREEKKEGRRRENREDGLLEVDRKKKRKRRNKSGRWLRWSSDARTKGRRLSSAWTFHEAPQRWRSFLILLSFLRLLLFRLLESIIPRFRREPDALPAEIRRWWWLIVLPLSRDNEIFVCAMRPPVRPSPLIWHSVSLSFRWPWIYRYTIYSDCVLSPRKNN